MANLSRLFQYLPRRLEPRHDRTSRQPMNLKGDVSVPVPPVPFLQVGNIVLVTINERQRTGVNKNKKFRDETEFCIFRGFDHACWSLFDWGRLFLITTNVRQS